MSSAELFTLIQSTAKPAVREVFDTYYGRLAPMANRYAKSPAQAEDLFNYSFSGILRNLKRLREHPEDLDRYVEYQFIKGAVEFIKSFKSEYFVASTVYATAQKEAKNYNLFENNDIIDFDNLNADLLVRSFQQLVPSQRLVINLHLIEGFSLEETAEILDSSQATVKSNLEKGRYNLQKNIEKIYKSPA